MPVYMLIFLSTKFEATKHICISENYSLIRTSRTAKLYQTERVLLTAGAVLFQDLTSTVDTCFDSSSTY